jgi:hypothetical protein
LPQNDERPWLPIIESAITFQGFIIISNKKHKIIDVPIIPSGCFKPGLEEGGIYCVVEKKEQEKAAKK